MLYPFSWTGWRATATSTFPTVFTRPPEGVEIIVERMLPTVETFLARLTAPDAAGCPLQPADPGAVTAAVLAAGAPAMEIRDPRPHRPERQPICLGTMTWGQQNTEAEGHEQMDYALDQGINFFDTAELYSDPAARRDAGRDRAHHRLLVQGRGSRDKVILASKVVGRSAKDLVP